MLHIVVLQLEIIKKERKLECLLFRELRVVLDLVQLKPRIQDFQVLFLENSLILVLFLFDLWNQLVEQQRHAFEFLLKIFLGDGCVKTDGLSAN